MEKATFYKNLNNSIIECHACNHFCKISKGKTGVCGVRQNIDNDLYLLVFNKVVSANIDPIEKKPLYHFYPGEVAFSFGTYGCNFSCEFCQNFDISQLPKIKELDYWGETMTADDIIWYCREHHIKFIAYTYNEPTIFVEYALEVMKKAKQYNIRNIFVSNGYMSSEVLDAIAPYLDAANIDLKSYQEQFYVKICHSHLEPVKENIKRIKELNIWEEITTLVIPQENDSEKEAKNIADFIAGIDRNMPWHISAFYPAYKMLNYPITPKETLEKFYQIGKEAGLNYIYIGNIETDRNNTYCPKCQHLLIKRRGFDVLQNGLLNSKCPNCGFLISGHFNNL